MADDIKKKIRENLKKTYPDMSDKDMDKSVDRFIRNIDNFLPTPSEKMNGTTKKAEGGMMNKSLKPVDKSKNPGLAKLPTGVRNKMGYMKDGGAVKREKKKEDKPQGLDPLGLMKPRSSKRKTYTQSKPKIGNPMPMTPDLIEKAKEGKYPNPRAPKIDRDEVIKAKPLKEGGMVLEIGLRPASKQEMKMAKEMKPQKKANGGMVARGTGAAIRGKGFKGVF
jgi:hypothetical protein